MNEKPDMMINIYGGNNLIAPVASSAIQNFYGDRGDEAADQPEDSEKTEFCVVILGLKNVNLNNLSL